MPFKNLADQAAYNARWRKKNPDKVRAIQRRVYEKNGKVYNARWGAKIKELRSLMTPEERKKLWRSRWHATYDRYFHWPRGTHERVFNEAAACGLCGDPFDESDDNLRKDTDHDHKTGAFRGIIHHNCNVALGLFGDDERKLERAIEYLSSMRTLWGKVA